MCTGLWPFAGCHSRYDLVIQRGPSDAVYLLLFRTDGNLWTNSNIKQDKFYIGKNNTLFHSLVASEGYTPQLRFVVEVQ